MAIDPEVARKLEALWPDPTVRERVLAELNRYGTETHEQESHRVWLAILRLCEARLDRLADLVTAAKQDYRDVLMWAEYPAESQAVWALRPNLSSEERRRLKELRRQDRQQYLEWLKK